MWIELPLPEATGEIEIMRNASYVYRAWDADGDLLYVGVTDNVHQRLAGHQRGRSEWLRHAVRVTWAQYVQRADAELVEAHLIRSLQPKYNRAENGRRLAAAQMGHRRMYEDAAWSVLGAVVRERRIELGMTQTSVARAAKLDVALVRSVERVEKTDYPAAALAALEGALDWHPGSVEAVLRGEVPACLSQDEVSARARASARSIMDRRPA
jgi:predicted GIY-YIG superfamily endonuclease